MGRAKTAQRIFISHAHANIRVARKVKVALQNAGHDSWLDDSNIHVGVMLRKELQQAIADSGTVVLVWSKAASTSRWVASEILTSFHLDRLIVPCVLDNVALPQFLSRSISSDLRRARGGALAKLGEQLKAVPQGRNEFPEAVPYQSPELLETVHHLNARQREILNAPDAKAVLLLQKGLDPEMRAGGEAVAFRFYGP